MLFLVDYDRKFGKIVSLKTFDNARRQEAEDARLELELQVGVSAPDREIVLLDAASEFALRKTHRRYFDDIETLAAALTNALQQT
jgi:hypothetical protein